ncbi:hypothetical protein NQ314_020302 [Rhamnusium bicolor]|uniref:Uncharacterized protein n=1 Tax=Rhamnusium bicolor TaxID=1586634 RepID=A0AAV8WNH5_9CUCU|nr:hypothetical protein NQ314_020302 [Rhamnusium bicolor]
MSLKIFIFFLVLMVSDMFVNCQQRQNGRNRRVKRMYSPQLPQFPQIPQIPQIPSIPHIPQIPQIPHIPIPSLGQVLDTTLDIIKKTTETLHIPKP